MTKEIIEKELEVCINRIFSTDKIHETSGRSSFRSSSYGVLDKKINAYKFVIYRFIEKRKLKLGIDKFRIEVDRFGESKLTSSNITEDTIGIQIAVSLKKTKETLHFKYTPKQAARSLKLNNLLQ